MNDFREAFRRGQDAWRNAEHAHREISAVFDQFAQQVQEASNERIHVRRDVRPGPGAREGIYNSLDGGKKIISGPRYNVLVATGADAPEPQGVEICQYETAEAGYPVTLQYARTEERCLDATALAEGLKRLLASPSTGRMLAQLMQGTAAA